MMFNYLDNLKRPVYNWYPYKEGFSWRLIDRCISLASQYIDIHSIGDPFVGSGTTLLRAKELNIKSYGVDISPFAYLLSYTKTRNWNFSEQDIQEVQELNIEDIDGEVEIFFELFPLSRAFSKSNYKMLKKLRYWVETKTELHLLALIRAAMEVSYIYKDGGVIRIRKRNTPSLESIFKKHLIRMMNERIVGILPEVEMKSAFEFDRSVDIIITSPPYLNNIDYTKIYGVELALTTLRRDYSTIRGRMMSSFIRKDVDSDSILPIKTKYLEESFELFRRFRDLLHGGILFYNVSNSIINGIYYEIDVELMRLMEEAGFREVKIVDSIVRKTNINGKLYRARESLIMARS
ncbi:MAG: DNA methyltransferase [Candidatus Anstonellales archaeon]